MVFTSLSFLYLFLPLTLLLYYILPMRPWRNGILLLASLCFYSWGEPVYILLMLAASLIAYLGGQIMEWCCRHEKVAKWRRPVFVLTLVLLLGNLVVFKYLNFLCQMVGVSVREIALPVGISFYTFQILSYVIDLYWGEIQVQKNPLYLTLYVSLFPQLIAGPIVRYQTIEHEILHRRECWDDFIAGLRRFIVGLGKKVLIANYAATVATAVYNSGTGGTAALWLGALAYTIEIYFDFSGYSDMAIGLGRMFGFHFLENFDYPYVSLSITEFWRRWHISLSSWFRDYVYIPLGGNRVGRAKYIRNLLIVWGLTGLWHGASWNFVLWGLYYGILLLLEKLALGTILKKLSRPFQWSYTFLVVMVGWVIFNLTDMHQLRTVLERMFTPHATDWVALISGHSELLFALPAVPIGLLLAFPLRKKLSENHWSVMLQNICCVAIFLMCITCLISSTFNPFIYFRF